MKRTTMAQVAADTRNDIVKMIDRMIRANRRRASIHHELANGEWLEDDPTFIDGAALKGKIEMMAKRAAAKPGGIGKK